MKRFHNDDRNLTLLMMGKAACNNNIYGMQKEQFLKTHTHTATGTQIINYTN